MRRPRLENSLLLATKGYGWLPDGRRARGRRTVAARLAGLPVLGIEGPDAARFLYDEDHVHRSHAIPEPVQATLFGKGAVQTLDGHEHRVRKAMFVALLMGEGVGPLVERAIACWDAAVPGWARRERIVLMDESACVLTRAVCDWAGVPVPDDEVPAMARDLTALVDGFATLGGRHWRARRARGRREA
jgi:fatty-acid peroxygenase